MSSSEDIENAIERASCEASEAVRRRIWEDAAKQRRSSCSVTGRVGTWKIAAAAVVTTGAAVSLLFIFAPLRGVSKAYGMTDLSALLENVRTLHVQSTCWLYEPDPNHPEFEHATVIPCEVWVDVPNLRTHFTSYMSWSTPEGQKGLNRVEGVHDRQYAMDIDHTEKTVRFNKVSVVQRRLAVRDEIRRYLNHIAEGELEHFVVVGQETINGALYDIWEREDVDIHHVNTRQRIRCWLAPATGEVGRIYIWSKRGDEPWRLGWCADTIERDIGIPDSVFVLKAPGAYRYQNTRETAFDGEGLGQGWYMMGGARVSVAINLTLDDGSVIVAWHSDDLEEDRHQEQGPLFKDLVPGSELPRLPMVIYGLRTTRMETYSAPEIEYVGRHLAFTQKGGWYYEWALYVPSQAVPPSKERPLYHMLCRFNLPNNQPPKVGNPLSENRIKANEFDLFVREAMAELSDDGKAPEHVTHENVMRWANEIRTSLVK
jgi:hypothetical protein